MSNHNTLPAGADHEIAFWKRFIKTEQFATWLATGKTPELDDGVAHLIEQHLQHNPATQVLDVACGVVSVLNGLVPKQNLTTADVLGLEYRKLFDYKQHDIMAPIDIGAEDLPFADVFDIVHIRNGLDHCQDVQKAFDRMVAACKPGGYVIVQGFENEATAENWKGFHQHDLWVTQQRETTGIWVQNGKGEALVIGQELNEFKSLTTFPNGKSWFIWIGQKPAQS